MATPNFIITDDYTYFVSINDSITLPKGTFVRPIEREYLPDHIVDDRPDVLLESKMKYCYTPRGIIALPKRIIKQV